IQGEAHGAVANRVAKTVATDEWRLDEFAIRTDDLLLAHAGEVSHSASAVVDWLDCNGGDVDFRGDSLTHCHPPSFASALRAQLLQCQQCRPHCAGTACGTQANANG